MSKRIPLSPDQVKTFILACHAKHDRVVELLDEQPRLLRASMDWGEGDWENGLEAAGHMGNRDITELLLSRGMDRTLFSAAMMGEKEIVERLLAADPGAVSHPGVHRMSLIYHIAISGDPDIAEIAKACGDVPGKDAAIHPAVKFGHLDMTTWLIDNGATDLNTLNFQEQTPLAVALENGNEDLANLLKQHGAAHDLA